MCFSRLLNVNFNNISECFGTEFVKNKYKSADRNNHKK